MCYERVLVVVVVVVYITNILNIKTRSSATPSKGYLNGMIEVI